MATVINRAIYFNIGGGQKQCSSLYMNNGASRKTISSAYGNVNGSRKQIFPYSASTIYTWNKYSLNSTSSPQLTDEGETYYPFDIISEEPTTTYYYGSGYSISGSTISLTGVKSVSWVNDRITYPSGIYYWLEYRTSGFGSIKTATASPETRLFYCDISDDNKFHYRFDTVTSYSRGSYVGQVTSSNRDAYPNNSYSGSYWYVFVS